MVKWAAARLVKDTCVIGCQLLCMQLDERGRRRRGCSWMEMESKTGGGGIKITILY